MGGNRGERIGSQDGSRLTVGRQRLILDGWMDWGLGTKKVGDPWPGEHPVLAQRAELVPVVLMT